jgi:hypothetical protein
VAHRAEESGRRRGQVDLRLPGGAEKVAALQCDLWCPMAHRSVRPNPRIQTIGFPALQCVNNLPIERVGPSVPSRFFGGDAR